MKIKIYKGKINDIIKEMKEEIENEKKKDKEKLKSGS